MAANVVEANVASTSEAAENNTSIEHTSILEYLTNPAYYSIINKNNKAKSKEINNKEDVRFYRKRIIALTKEKKILAISLSMFIRFLLFFFNIYLCELI